jgi:2,3-dihydroxybenzoate decarboxylase
MQGKIGLEEHFAIPETLEDSAEYATGGYWPALRERLLDIHGLRLELMDARGIATMILSLNAPAVQAIPQPDKARDIAVRANDFLAEQVALRPDRFQAFAALPMQDPEMAARELERCMGLGFRGALVNGFSQVGSAEGVVYYDGPEYAPFWHTAERLDAPFYLHPRNPIPSWAPVYRGHEWLLGPTWAFAHETATHALRLMGSGLFDRNPRLKIILGHMGEGLPSSIFRVDHRTAWMKAPKGYPAKRLIGDYFRENFWVTTSGNFHTATLLGVMLEMGADRVLFSTDCPFESLDDAAGWFDRAAISEADRQKIGRENARKLFQLDKQT